MLADSKVKIQALPRIVFGRGEAAKLSQHVALTGKRSALIVTDKGLVEAGLIKTVADGLTAAGIKALVFAGVEPNPSDANVEAGAEALRGLGDAAIVAVGGGSSMDAAKAIGLMGPNEGTVNDFGFGCKPKHEGAPLVAVPTTAGTGSETNMFAVITDRAQHRKIYVGHPSIQPKVAVLDPDLTLGLPPYPTATCGFDVLTHAIEAYTSLIASPYTDAVALETIRMAAKWLPEVFKDGRNIEARAQMLMASCMAAIAFNVTGLGVCHGTGHPLSARLGSAHGQTLATMLPHVMRFNRSVCGEKYALVATALGVEASADAAIAEVEAIRARVGIKKTIKELGGDASLIDALSDDAMADLTTRTNARKVERADAKALYEAALN